MVECYPSNEKVESCNNSQIKYPITITFMLKDNAKYSKEVYLQARLLGVMWYLKVIATTLMCSV